MYYEELMEPLSEDHFIDNNASIKEVIAIMKDRSIDIALINHAKENKFGILTKDQLITAYNRNISIHEPVSRVMNSNYKIFHKNALFEEDIFKKTPLILLVNDHNKIVGMLSKDKLPSAILKISMEKINNTSIRKIFHPDMKSKRQDSLINFNDKLNQIINSNKELWDIIEFSPDSIYVTDKNGITAYANTAFEKMTGTPVNAILGISVFELESKEIYKPSVSAIVLKEKRPVTLIQKSCNGKDLIVTGIPVFDSNQNIHMVICNSRDVDEHNILKKYLLNRKAMSEQIINNKKKPSKIIYASHYMHQLMATINKITKVDSTVLITGESGTGKGLIAKYIHNKSKRANKKFIDINCSAIPETLLESELFGYEAGAFTGAKKSGKPGLIEIANNGTLFLDEIGDMSLHMQVKLLKVLQDKQIIRVGATDPIDINVRIIAATNKDLKQLVKKDAFREDLYYRLNVFPIHLAPLRERREDIYALIQHYLSLYNKMHNKKLTLTYKAKEKLASYSWPGNVRELDHYIERLVLIEDSVIDANGIKMEQNSDNNQQTIIVNELTPLKKALDETEKQLIHLATNISQNSYDVADLLKISQASAYRKIQKYK